MTDRATALAGAAILFASISVNLGAAIAKGLFPQIGPEGVAALRSLIAAPVLLALFRPWRSPVTAGQWRWLVLYGAALGVMNLLIYWAFERIPIGLAVTIEIAGPLSVVLLTSRTTRDFLWLALAVGGLLLLVPWQPSAHALDPVGIACALGAALCWALYIVLGRRAAQVRGSSAVAIGMCVACVVTLPFGIAGAGAKLFGPALPAAAAVALLSSALPYLLEITALERVSSRVFGALTSCAPAIAALMGWLVLGEELRPLQGLAVVLMIAASAGCSLAARPAVPKATEAIPN
ncbi:MAG: EamA family transporter [Candidatus Andeanibacterium colombiense]|uniref:EamA family transporter n=1 Tax=Candidatus Andeanibacterium colombiense TaxID=3121345 RepID=A0AAJ5X6H6_9SPHN|nr:MAG: EamA family transporter [Sphingomonadaceae bacterium]